MKFIKFNKLQRPAGYRRQGLWRLLSAAALSSLLIASPAQSDIFYVTTDNDGVDSNPGNGHCATATSSCTLRAAIQEANALIGADEIIITSGFNPQLTISTISENSAATGDLDITSDLTIRGGGSSRTIINGAGLGDRIFHVLGKNKTIKLTNISIKGAKINNTNGAGVLIQGSGTVVTIENSSIIDNEVYILPSATVAPGFAESGGGIYVDADAKLILNRSDINNNIAPFGAGITNLGRIEVLNSTITNNTAQYTFSGAARNGYGGGIMNLGGYLNIGNSTITSNTAGQGGGLYHTNAGLNVGNTIITNSTFDNNSALLDSTQIGGFGGGILNVGPMTLSNSSINNNHADGDGGGLASIGGLSNVDITNTTISTNAARSGGGIFTTRDVTLTNTTIYNNQASPQAGAPDPGDIDGCITNTQCTIGGNEIAVYDTNGSSSQGDPSVTIVNTIIANETGNGEDVCAGLVGFESFIQSTGNNLENTDTCGLTTSTDIINSTAIQLAALVVETDPGTAVHPLLASSDAVDNGNDSTCPAVDQRFMLRGSKQDSTSLGACDIGAYEYGADDSVKTTYMDLKLTIDDNLDPVAPNDNQELLTYSVVVTNLSADVAAENFQIAIDLPLTVNFVNLTNSSTDVTPSCSSTPTTTNRMTCYVTFLPGLGRIEIFVSVIPTVETIITANAEISNSASLNPPDSFLGNNSDTEDTEVTTVGTGSSGTNNFNGLPPGGGGVIQPLLLIITGLLLARRRQQQASQS